MNTLSKKFIKSTFPKLRFAIQADSSIKPSKTRQSKLKINELLLVTDDAKAFHKENYATNKQHYPFFTKIFGTRLPNFFQVRGAKAFFNNFTCPEGEQYRYAVVERSAFKDDLTKWKHLVSATYLQKPYIPLIEEDIDELQQYNLRSAIAFALLLNLRKSKGTTVVRKTELYENILNIPFIQLTWLRLYSKIETDTYISAFENELDAIYLPILESEPFSTFVKFRKNLFFIENSCESRLFFLENVGSEVIQHFSVLKYTPDFFQQRLFSKTSYEKDIRQFLAQKHNQIVVKGLQKSVNHILKRHQLTRISVIIMGKWFFIIFTLFKYVIKGFILFYFFKH